MNKYTIGIDVGGTNIKCGLVNDKGKVVARTVLPTKSYGSNKQLLMDALVGTILTFIQSNKLTSSHIRGIGIGLPGLIDPVKGIVHFLPNIPGWKNVPLAKFIQKKTKIATFLENDVNLITLAEWKFGAGRGVKNLICITLGTGVGGGLIFNNALYRGEGFVAGEIGHMPINESGPQCPCGGEGCFERYVGNGTLKAQVQKIFKNKNIDLPDLYKDAKKGNPKILSFWKQTGQRIGHALVGVVNLLNPRLIIIGGGVSNNLIFMQKSIESVIQQRAMKVQSSMVKIVRAKLHDDAGIIGATVLVSEANRS